MEAFIKFLNQHIQHFRFVTIFEPKETTFRLIPPFLNYEFEKFISFASKEYKFESKNFGNKMILNYSIDRQNYKVEIFAIKSTNPNNIINLSNFKLFFNYSEIPLYFNEYEYRKKDKSKDEESLNLLKNNLSSETFDQILKYYKKSEYSAKFFENPNFNNFCSFVSLYTK